MNEEKPLAYTFRFFLCAILTVLIVMLVSITFGKIVEKRKDEAVSASTKNENVAIVIDPGHGGEDPGSVADDGTLEKDLNLEIANLVKALCILNGQEVKMTRTEDTLLYDYYDDLQDYTGKKKIYDLKNRLKIAEESKGALYLGIHMNKFSQAKYSGVQIYYSKNATESYSIASDLSKSIKTYLQPNNNRQIKGADSSIYILNNIENPAILVECGFLSNENELAMLKNEEYRAKLALVIFSSIYNYNP